MNAEEAKEKARELFNARNTNLDDLTFYDLEIKISQALLQTDALAREEQRESDLKMVLDDKYNCIRISPVDFAHVQSEIAKAIRDSNKGGK